LDSEQRGKDFDAIFELINDISKSMCSQFRDLSEKLDDVEGRIKALQRKDEEPRFREIKRDILSVDQRVSEVIDQIESLKTGR
jgi:Mg2+ and Co2+ transporter CorA